MPGLGAQSSLVCFCFSLQLPAKDRASESAVAQPMPTHDSPTSKPHFCTQASALCPLCIKWLPAAKSNGNRVPGDVFVALLQTEQKSKLLIAVVHKVWVAVENGSYMRVGSVVLQIALLWCFFFPQINESLDTWQVPVCKSLGRSSILSSEYQGLFLSV